MEKTNNQPLMTCRYCILHELGHCRKQAPLPPDKEPRYLRLKTGTLVSLVFDCQQCEMRLYEYTAR
ncbi:MAG: hypothetical protein MJZ84_06495 [Paludibacteraceae bacterium]|nr:hypothetical protein [Paludibacteraceae bacterium]